MAKIRFEANIPVEIALKFSEGKRSPTKLRDTAGQLRTDVPDEMFYTLCGDDTMYVPLHVADQITQLGIRKMELFSICKTVRNKVTRWLVQRVGDTNTQAIAPVAKQADEPPAPTWDDLPTDLEATLEASVKLQQQRNALAHPKIAPSTAAVATVPQTLKIAAPLPNSHTTVSLTMASSMIAAIDAAMLAEQYAASKGIPVKPLSIEFLAEDIRAIAATIFIQASKDPLLFAERTPQKVNGGTTWPRQ